MESFIEEIYEYSMLYTKIKEGITEARQFRLQEAEEIYNSVYKQLCNCCRRCLEAGNEYASDLTQTVIQMSEYKNDFIMLSDHLERGVLPFLQRLIREFADIDIDTENGYRILSSDLGYLTAQITESGMFIHSTYDPMEEARIYIQRRFEPICSEYIIFGSGMGYYAYQLYKISRGSVKITIYERDSNLLSYARKYGVLDWIPESVLNVIVTDDNSLFLEHSMRSGVKAIFHYAEIDVLEGAQKEALLYRYMDMYISSFMKEASVMNFYRNLEVCIPDVSEMKESVKSDAVIVGAGPSLDMTMDFLKNCKGKKTIIAVNTVFKKLIKGGISPDFVIVLDSSELMDKQLEGVEKEKVPLIIDLCAYWRWCRDYQGPKYRVYSTYTCREAEEFIRNNGKEKWPSGGTVAFLAMEFAYRMGAKNLYFVGVDLGYPEGKSYTTGTDHNEEFDHDKKFEVDQVGGGKVYTDYTLNRYRESLEIRISQLSNKACFYNLSKVGARISGTIEVAPDSVMI